MAQLKLGLSVVRDGATAWIGHVEMEPVDIDFETRDAGDEDAALNELCRQLANELERLASELRTHAGELSQ